PAERVARLIADLDDDRFPVREAASRDLEQLAELAGPALRRALAERPSLELRRRVEGLLRRLEMIASSPRRLQGMRALMTLEPNGTAEARRVLQRLADGAPEACLTSEACTSLRRLATRPPSEP